MSTDSDDPDLPEEGSPEASGEAGSEAFVSGKIVPMLIEEELKTSYLNYSMSVIIDRALPDVRDGLKPSQRRILVAMNDLNLGPGSNRVKCAKISGDTSGNYHPHGEAIVYPTLVRMAQDWNMRYVLVDKQGNFGSIAGLPPAAMRYTEARMSAFASLMLEDLELGTVDFVPTYDERRLEPTVLPSKLPNLLVNGANGIAVAMATSIPPHNLGEVCDGLVRLIDDPDITVDELMEIIPGPDFPTGGMVLSRSGLRRGYHTGRGTIILRARTRIEEYKKDRFRIVVTEIPYQQARDRVEERIAQLVNEGRIKGISAMRNESDLKEPVRLILEIKRDADPEIVLNQLYQFSPLQESYSINLRALVNGKPWELSLKQLLEEFLRHRVTVIRRRTQFLLAKARARKHTVEGLLLAHVNIDEIIRIIRTSATQAEAKARLMGVECPAAMMARALGEEGFAAFQAERGTAPTYMLTAVQSEAILRMTLGQLVNLEQEKLANEFRNLLTEISEHVRLLSDEKNLLAVVRQETLEIRKKHADKRRTEISEEELGSFDMADLITEETMVVTISHNGYVKRLPVSTYRAQRRGGKGLIGARTEDEDPIQHLFVASTHAYLLFFTNRGKVFWQKVYDLPQLSRESRGRALVNLLNLAENERIADCIAVRDFAEQGRYLMMATRSGLVKKTPLEAYSRPQKGGIIAIKLKEEDELVDVVVTKPGDEVVLATQHGMAIRFNEADARPMGRNTSGVKGIKLSKDDCLVGMVVADPEATLLTACAHGYGKRTLFGPNSLVTEAGPADEGDESGEAPPAESAAAAPAGGEEEGEEEASSSQRYRTQRRGGKGVRDIKTTERNGPVVGIVGVHNDDELMMMTARGKIQRIAVRDLSVIGRNTQGVRIMTLDEEDTLAAVVRVPSEEAAESAAVAAASAADQAPRTLPEPPGEPDLESDAGESENDES